MRLFTLIDFQHLVLAIFLGSAAAIAIFLTFRYPSEREKEGQGASQVEGDYPPAYRTGAAPVPPVLVLLIIGFLVWLVAYIYLFAISGGPI